MEPVDVGFKFLEICSILGAGIVGFVKLITSINKVITRMDTMELRFQNEINNMKDEIRHLDDEQIKLENRVDEHQRKTFEKLDQIQTSIHNIDIGLAKLQARL